MMCSGNSLKILIYTKLIFSYYNIFTNINIYFAICFLISFQSSTNKYVNQIRNIDNRSSSCCSWPCFRALLCTHYGPLQFFSTYFRKSKEIGILRTIFPDYVISCDYVNTHQKQPPEVFCKKRCSYKFCKIHRKTPVPEYLFNKVVYLGPATLIKKRLWHRCFPVTFVKFLRTSILENTSGQLLLTHPSRRLIFLR